MKDKIGIVGLGYVGLPLALAFSEKYPVVGLDIDKERIIEIQKSIDKNKESETKDIVAFLKKENDNKKGLFVSGETQDLKDCRIYIVTVPTPIDEYKNPDLTFLVNASKNIAPFLQKNDMVIYESTVYPGCTEEICVPVLEKFSHLKYNKDFFCGYSPERINPGDKVNTIKKIKKITSGSNEKIAEKVDQLYASIIDAGTYKVSSIKVAEAAKAIENAQRDLNISFVNELALIFDRIGIDTNEVIEAAATKWNFMKFKPGLVGGHCIGVDPYYLVHKAESVGYHPEVILSGRRVNDNMPQFVANKLVKLMIANDVKVKNANVLILGFAFKENCADFRNTKVADLYKELKDFGIDVDVVDNWVDTKKVHEEYGIKIASKIDSKKKYSGIVLAVAHQEFQKINFQELREKGTIIFDIKGIIDKNFVHARL